MPRPFIDIIGEMSGGRTHEQLTQRMGDLVERVSQTGASGTITLTIKVSATGDNSVEVNDTIKTKLPEFPRPKSMFFVDGTDLTRKDPRQAAMSFTKTKQPLNH